MKKIILFLITIFLLSCSSDKEESKTEIKYNNLKAYNKGIYYAYYSPDLMKNGIYSIALDTINSTITQNSIIRNTTTGDKYVVENFIIKETISFPNYKNSNIDYFLFNINYSQTYTYDGSNYSLTRDKPYSIILSHKINTDKFLFDRIYYTSTEMFFDNFNTVDYFQQRLPR